MARAGEALGESVSASVLTQHSIYTEELNPALNLAGIMVEDGGEGCLHTDSRTIAVETLSGNWVQEAVP